MLIKRHRGWELPEREATPEHVFLNRRQFMGTAGMTVASAGLLAASSRPADAFLGLFDDTVYGPPEDDPTWDLYPVARNERYALDRDVTPERYNFSYNNFFEFGSQKTIARDAQRLEIRPWTVTFDGLVEQERTVGIDDLIRAMPLEERLYRLRCVEAWAMAVPWSGFSMRAMIDFARPLSSARYVRMETFFDPEISSAHRTNFSNTWPYVEGLTMAEARNELAFMVTGAYGKPLPKQMGSPLRLAVPWKYGFKSIKSIVRVTFTTERPVSFWEATQGSEYGFWANVNPAVPHARWSQADERLLGAPDDRRVPTQIYNGYGDFVADLYSGLEGERLYM
ncbi:MAG: protein-methionine-sulfoxide reductase catalytic subunit MsrP [Pseudomonadota bacterium]